MNPSNNHIHNPLIDLHQQKKQKKRQQLQTNGLFYNTTTPIMSGQYHDDPHASLPSLSNLMSTHSVIASTVDQQQMMRTVPTGTYVATPNMPAQIKQDNHIYNTNDQKIIGGTVYNHPHLDNTHHHQGYSDNKSLNQKQHLTNRPSLTGSSSSQMTAAMDNNSLTFYQRSPVVDIPSSSNVEAFFHPSMQPIASSTQPFNEFNQQKLEDPHKIYSFVPLDVVSQQKRPRKKFNEVERLYQCTYLNCTKAYGTLNHLNAHVTMQGHGPKRLPAEFKELRKQLKNSRQKKQKSIKESPTATGSLSQQHSLLINNHNSNNQNEPYVTTTPMIVSQHSYRPYHPPSQSFAQSFAQPYQARPYQQQQYTMMQPTDHPPFQ